MLAECWVKRMSLVRVLELLRQELWLIGNPRSELATANVDYTPGSTLYEWGGALHCIIEAVEVGLATGIGVDTTGCSVAVQRFIPYHAFMTVVRCYIRGGLQLYA